MEVLSWETFKSNVEGWAESRGIYEQSTMRKQLEKLDEETIELEDARNRLEEMDAIGDMMVCAINAKKLGWWFPLWFFKFCMTRTARSLGHDFMECCTKAWNEIKDRKGLMVDGLFVKWDNLTEEQQAECQKRGQL